MNKEDFMPEQSHQDDHNAQGPGSYVLPQELRKWTSRILCRFGFDQEAVDCAADMLVEADVHGLRSHGVSLLLPRYLILMERGLIGKGAAMTVLQETATTALVDGRDNLGAIVAEKAVGIAVAKAQQNHAAWVAVRHSNHLGPLAHWCRKIVAHDLIGLVLSNAGPDMAVHGSFGKTIGTNPICVGAPGNLFPVILDMASSASAMGKIRAAALNHDPIPPQWGMDRIGRPTTDPREVLEGGALLPLGGHKGSGLAIVVDILCAMLSGANDSTRIPPVSKAMEPPNVGHLFGAIRIDAFGPIEEFRRSMTRFADTLHALPRLPEVDRILLPGEIEFETAQACRKEGVFFSSDAWRELERMANQYDCPLPERLACAERKETL